MIVGGAERADTVAAALERVKPDCDFVAVHDAARPCLTVDQAAEVFRAAETHGAALLATPVFETIKRVNADRLTIETVSRDDLYLAQTPQVFRREWLVEAYARRAKNGKAATDDTQLVEAIGHPCAIVPGSSHNLKITTQDDLAMAKAVFALRDRGGRRGNPPAIRSPTSRRSGTTSLESSRPTCSGSRSTGVVCYFSSPSSFLRLGSMAAAQRS